MDSNEPVELIEAIVHAGMEVKRVQLRAYICKSCGRWYQNNFTKCPQCQAEPDEDTKTVRVADIAHDTGKFGLERKHGDFWSSLESGNLYEQLQGIARVYGHNGGLVLEELINNVIMEHQKHEQWIRSIKGECWNLGIHFEECEQMEDIAQLVKWLDKKVGEEIKNRGVEIQVAVREPAYEALRRCNRIGDEKADMLFFLFKDLGTIAQQQQGTFQGLPGIGPETAKELHDFFHKTVVREWTPKPRKRKQK